MGDQRLEWKIQEEDDLSKSEVSKMSMILNKGWRLGKKIVITGVAISSAPIVFPPLIILSTIGFAVAVPFGFAFFTYACTEKLMSKLLSRPLIPPSLLEYKIYDDDDYVEEEDFQEDGYTGEFMDDDHEEEENKFREDTKETLEMRIELIGDEKDDEGFVVDLNEEKPVEDMNGVMEEESTGGTYFGNFVEEEEKSGEYMNGVMEEERADGTYFDNYVEEEEKPVEEYVGDTEEENLMGGTGGVMGDYREDEEEVDETIKEEEKLVEVISDEIEEEELLMREMEEARDEENADNAIEFEEGGVKENVGNIEEEEMRQVRETEGVVEESRDEENVGMTVVEEEKSELGMEGEKGEESDELVQKGKKQLEPTAENMEEEERLIREANGGLEDSRDEEPWDKLIATDNVEEQNAEEIGGEQNVNGMAQENYIVGKELPSPRVEIIGVIKVENVNDVAQEDAIVEDVVPVVDVALEGYSVEEAVPVVDVTQVGYNGVVEEENVNDVAEEDYIVQQVVPVVEMNGVTKEENRDDESVGKFANDIEQVRPRTKEVMEESKEGVDLEKNIEREEIPVEKIHGIVKGHEEGVNNVLQKDKPIRMKKERRGEEVLDRVPEVEGKPVEEMGAMVEETQDEEKADKIGLMDTNGVVDERRDEGITDRMVEERKKPKVETETRLVPSQTENAREIADESGLDFFDDDIAGADQSYSRRSVDSLDHEVDSLPHHVSLEQVSTVAEPTTDNLPKEMEDSAGHPLSVEMVESKFNKEAHEQKGIIPSKEVLYSEEKIWEQIDAMRKIVGYKAALQTTCIEELKALYVFTGVEPPLAFKVPSDLAEINDKLRLLMSIIGVK